MKRLSNIWNDVVSVDLTVQDIIDGTKYKRGKREVKKLLYDKDVVAEHPELWHQIDNEKAKEYAKYLIAMLEDGTWIRMIQLARLVITLHHGLQICCYKTLIGS